MVTHSGGGGVGDGDGEIPVVSRLMKSLRNNFAAVLITKFHFLGGKLLTWV